MKPNVYEFCSEMSVGSGCSVDFWAFVHEHCRMKHASETGAEMSFGDKVREIMRARRVSIGAFAKEIGVGQATVHAWICGGAMPRAAQLEVLSRRLKLLPEVLTDPKLPLPADIRGRLTRRQIRHLLVNTGLLPRHLAKMAQVDQTEVADWMSGRSYPSKGAWHKISEAVVGKDSTPSDLEELCKPSAARREAVAHEYLREMVIRGYMRPTVVKKIREMLPLLEAVTDQKDPIAALQRFMSEYDVEFDGEARHRTGFYYEPFGAAGSDDPACLGFEMPKRISKKAKKKSKG